MDREAIWSIRPGKRPLFSGIAIAFFILGFVFTVPSASPDDIVNSVGTAGIFSITLTFFLFMGTDIMGVMTEYFKRQEREKGKQEGVRKRDAEIRDWYRKEKEKGAEGFKQGPPPPEDPS